MANPPNNYLPGYKEVKHHELRTAETDAAYLLPTLTSMAKSNPHLKLVDIGCGSGTITSSLAKHIPHGHVTAIDISSEILCNAERHAREQGVTNITFQPASIFSLPFEDGTFDITHSSQILCYLPDPLPALKEILRVLKPGTGIAAIRECDMRMWSFHPPLPSLVKFHQLQLATHEAGGGTNTAGPQLLSWALKAGVPRERVQVSFGTWCYSTLGERRVWAGSWAERIRLGGVGRLARGMAMATEGELEDMARGWEEWAECEGGVFAAMHGEILIRR